jgi:hypothetical protein
MTSIPPVTDVRTVDEFLKKYYIKDRWTPTLLNSYREFYKQFGYCVISKHDCITGEAISFTPEK